MATKKKAAKKKAATAAKKKETAKPKRAAVPSRERKRADPKKLFAKYVRAMIASHPKVAAIKSVRGEFALEIVLDDGYKLNLYLTNAYAETRELDPQAREQHIRTRYLDLLSRPNEDNDDWEQVRDRLFPTLRAASFGLQALLMAKQGSTYSVVRREFVPNVNLQVAIDSERSILYATRESLEKWGVTAAVAVERAFENARESFTMPAPYDDALGPMFHVVEDDDYQSSRLTLPGLLGSFRDQVEGRPIAIIPERAQLYIAGDARDEMVERLIELAEREWKASTRAISPAVYTVTDDNDVVPYHRAPNDPLRNKLLLGHARLALREYSEQKDVLEKLHERDNVDIFVATLNGLVRKDGRPVTWALWGEGIDTLLPFAELVVVGSEDGSSMHVPWSSCAEVMGAAWYVREDLSPPRIHPRRWPVRTELDRLRNAAIDIDALV